MSVESSLVKKFKAPNRKRSSRKIVALEVSLANAGKGPNLSRKNQGSMIYSFPSFDKCDSLLFFTSRFAAHLNSGDQKSFTKLINSRIDNNCDIVMSGLRLNLMSFFRMFELSDEFHPDQLMCLHSTKVCGNEIISDLYYKYTDNPAIHSSMERIIKDPIILAAFSGPRSKSFDRETFLLTMPERERSHIAYLLNTSDDLTVYGRASIVLKFDDFTKKITNLTLQCGTTSVSAI